MPERQRRAVITERGSSWPDAAGLGQLAAPASEDSQSQTQDDLLDTWELLCDAVTAVVRNLAAGLNAEQLGLSEFDVLSRLARGPDRQVPLQAIAHDLGLTPAGLGKLVTRMERDGLLTTRTDGGAPCFIQAFLTDRGRQRLAVARRSQTEHLEQHLLGPLGHRRLRELSDLAQVLRDANAARLTVEPRGMDSTSLSDHSTPCNGDVG